MTDKRMRHEVMTGLLSDASRWWPITLIGVAVIAIRLPTATARVGSWIWAPVGFGLLAVLVHRRKALHLSTSVALFGGYLAYSALSLLWSPNSGRGVRFVALLGVAFLAFVYGRTIGPPGGSSEMWRAGSIGLGVAIAGLLLIPAPASVDHLNPDRILAMGLIALVVMSWYGPRRRLYTLGIGIFATGACLISGSRTASIMMIGLLITAPGLRLPRTGRWMLLGSMVALVMLMSITPGFQERWFESSEGDLWDIANLENVQTSGRADVWPIVIDSCRDIILGEGAGASDSFAFEANQGFPEPHNEYLRIWCDTGLIGSVLFWGFVALVGVRAATEFRNSKRSWRHGAAMQMAAALLLLSITDNPLTTAVPFMIPAALAFGWSEQLRSDAWPPDWARALKLR